MSSDTVRQQAIECMAKQLWQTSQSEYDYEPTDPAFVAEARAILDALLAAGFVVLAPGEVERDRVAGLVTDLGKQVMALFQGVLNQVEGTDGGDAS